MRGESREKFTKKILRRIKFYTMIERYESRLKGNLENLKKISARKSLCMRFVIIENWIKYIKLDNLLS